MSKCRQKILQQDIQPRHLPGARRRSGTLEQGAGRREGEAGPNTGAERSCLRSDGYSSKVDNVPTFQQQKKPSIFFHGCFEITDVEPLRYFSRACGQERLQRD